MDKEEIEKFILNIVTCKFNFIQKIVYIDKMLNDKDLRQFYKFYSPLTVQDKIYFILI